MSKAKKKQATAAINPGLCDVILTPVITEKSQGGVEQNKVTFKVARSADKVTVKKAVEALFGVQVTKVNVINVKGKLKRFRGVIGRRNHEKKAVVTLAEGQTIDISAAV